MCASRTVSRAAYAALEVAARGLEISAVDMTEMSFPHEEWAAVIGEASSTEIPTTLPGPYLSTLSAAMETELREAGQLRFER